MDLDQNTIEAKLNDVTGKVIGCIAAGVVGADGIPISEFKKLEELDISFASAELASIVADSKRILKDLQSGALEESITRSEELTLVTRNINEEYFVYLIMKGSLQNLGLARLELKRLGEEFKEAFSSEV